MPRCSAMTAKPVPASTGSGPQSGPVTGWRLVSTATAPVRPARPRGRCPETSHPNAQPISGMSGAEASDVGVGLPTAGKQMATDRKEHQQMHPAGAGSVEVVRAGPGRAQSRRYSQFTRAQFMRSALAVPGRLALAATPCRQGWPQQSTKLKSGRALAAVALRALARAINGIRRTRCGLALMEMKAMRVWAEARCTPSTKRRQRASTSCGLVPSARSLSPA